MFRSAKYLILFLALVPTLWLAGVGWGEETSLENAAESAWKNAWEHFYSPETRLFYDFLESLTPGETLSHLPTAEEVANLDPNPCGYGTGMEDCAISGGIALEALVDRYENAKRFGADSETLERIRTEGSEVFSGLESLVTVSGSPGFVARGISPKAPDRCYINSSRDQATHLTLAVWTYFRSSLSDEASRRRAADILYAVADRMTRNVTPENDYDFLCSDGSRCRIGICRMANVEDHEAARLTAIYAVAWDAAKRLGDDEREREYWGRWRKIAKETIAQSAHLIENSDLANRMPPYAYLQMQESLSVLFSLEPEDELKERLATTMTFVANRAKSRQEGALKKLKSRDLTAVAPSWREVGGLNGEYRTTWYSPRECGEIALTILLDSSADEFDARSAETLKEALRTPDYSKLTSCGILHLIGAYEKARRFEKL